MNTFDAIIIGAGHNGLVAAAALARAGWSVVVLEAEDEVGGCVRSGEVTVPGVIHDIYSTNQNLFRQSPAYQSWKDDLERHGLRFAHSDTPFCNVFEDGTALRAYADLDRTAAEMTPADAEGLRRLKARFDDLQQVVLPLYAKPLPSAGALAAAGKGAAAIGAERTSELARTLLASTRELGETYFETNKAKALLATWGMHMDFGPDVSGGAVFPLMETFSNIGEGMVVAEGGASNVSRALVGLIEDAGGTVRTGARVERVLVEDGRASGVVLEGGERVAASRSVVANLVPHVLFGNLLEGEPLPPDFRRKVDGYQHGPGTFMLHLALDGPAPWAAGDDIAEFAYVHIPPTVDDLARTYQQSLAGLLPDSPLLIVGQTTAVDPTRAPDGTHVLWVQVRTVPGAIEGDAAGEIEVTDWAKATEPFTERVLDKLERFAPGVRDRIIGRHAMSPADLEAHNANLIGGDSLGGSIHLRQNLTFRPFPGWSRYETPVEGLYLCGAATWPGPGNNGTSGWLVAERLRATCRGRAWPWAPPPARPASGCGRCWAATSNRPRGRRRRRGRGGLARRALIDWLDRQLA